MKLIPQSFSSSAMRNLLCISTSVTFQSILCTVMFNCLAITNCSAQHFNWAINIKKTVPDAGTIVKIQSAKGGDLFVLTLSSSQQNYYLTKYGSNGQLVKSVNILKGYPASISDFAIDEKGIIYVDFGWTGYAYLLGKKLNYSPNGMLNFAVLDNNFNLLKTYRRDWYAKNIKIIDDTIALVGCINYSGNAAVSLDSNNKVYKNVNKSSVVLWDTSIKYLNYFSDTSPIFVYWHDNVVDTRFTPMKNILIGNQSILTYDKGFNRTSSKYFNGGGSSIVEYLYRNSGEQEILLDVSGEINLKNQVYEDTIQSKVLIPGNRLNALYLVTMDSQNKILSTKPLQYYSPYTNGNYKVSNSSFINDSIVFYYKMKTVGDSTSGTLYWYNMDNKTIDSTVILNCTDISAYSYDDNLYYFGGYNDSLEVDFHSKSNVELISGPLQKHELFIVKYGKFNLGVRDLEHVNKIFIYPNPSTGKIFIKGIPSNLFEIELFSVQGQIVHTYSLNNNQEIDISEIEGGIYFLNIGDSFYKIVKE